jgi:hypothetical protein
LVTPERRNCYFCFIRQFSHIICTQFLDRIISSAYAFWITEQKTQHSKDA